MVQCAPRFPSVRHSAVCAICLALLAVLAMASAAPAAEKIGALGRIQAGPNGDGIVRLGGPPEDTILDILVRENQRVEKGTPLVVFGSRQINERQLSLARLSLQEAVELGDALIEELALKDAATETHDRMAVEFQETVVAAAREDHRFLSARLEKLDGMGPDVVTTRQIDELRHKLAAADIALQQAEKKRDMLEAVRRSGLDTRRRELQRVRLKRTIDIDRAEQQVAAAQQRLAMSTLVAPGSGTILEIRQNVGEKASPTALMTMADLQDMYVVADIYENDALQVHPGMRAEISSSSLPAPLLGTVESIARTVASRSRNVHARIRLDDADTAARLINLEVNVSIGP